ncbi:MAG TPA: CopG family transcriptional regulator [Armatimonadetes bacterium]|nr:CopG family transcriptional regulator [Armatimonadota bacterium]
MAKKTPDRHTLTIPSLLHEQLEEMVKETEFESVEDFVVFVLRDVVAGRKRSSGTEYSADEVERVKDRLRSLGYL